MSSISLRDLTLRCFIVSLAVCLLVAATIASVVHESNDRRTQQQLRIVSNQIIEQVKDRLELYQYGLRGMRGAVLAAGDRLSRDGIVQYNATRDIDVEFPGARGFGFIRRVRPEDESLFADQAAADGWPDFKVRQLAPHDGERFVIQYIEPVGRNEEAVGLDIASERNRRMAALSAIRSGEVRLTGPITLVQATGNPLQSFLILMPVYRGAGTPESIAEREERAFGWSYAPLLTEEVLQDLRIDPSQLRMELFDVTQGSESERFYVSGDGLEGPADAFEQVLGMDVFGRRWQAVFTTRPAFSQALALPSPVQVLFLGGLISLLLATLLATLVSSRSRRAQYQAQQARLAAIVENSADGIVGEDLNGRITSWNPAAESLLGFSAAEAIGSPFIELAMHADDRAAARKAFEQACHGESVLRTETVLRRRDGASLSVSMVISPIRGIAGNVVSASRVVRDVSAEVAARAEILALNANLEDQVSQRTSELSHLNTLLRNVLRSASEVSIIATDPEGVITVFNAGAELMLGYTASEMIGKATPALVHLPEEVEARGRELTQRYGEPIEGFRVFVHEPELRGAETREWTYVRKDGVHLTVSLSVTAMRDESGEINGYLGIAGDITERKAAEERLTQSLEVTRAILGTASNPIVTIDACGTIRSFNPAAESVFGYRADEVVGESMRLLVPDIFGENGAGLGAMLDLAAPDARRSGREVEACRRDGSSFSAQISLGSMRTGSEGMVVAIFTDMTEQRVQRDALAAARDQLSLAADAAELGVWSWDIAGDTMEWNDRMFDLYQQPVGLRAAGIRVDRSMERVHPDDVDMLRGRLQASLNGSASFDAVFRLLLPDGSIRHIQANGHVERDQAGVAVRMIGVNRDITEQLELENRLRYAKDQADAASAAKSSFLANMSHEIRTPMNAVLGMLQILSRGHLEPRQRDYLSKAHNAARSMLRLLNDLLDYSKIEAGKLELDHHPFRFEDLMRDLSVVISGIQTHRDVEVVYDLPTSFSGGLVGDSLRLQQVLINLASNALKFTLHGEVVIEVSELAADSEGVRLRFSVRDTGIGIESTQLERIFEGFAQAETSISRRFGGTGLGLSISRHLVELMGGELRVESTVGVGSRFWFEIAMKRDDTLSDDEPAAPSTPPSLRVLLVEDNEVVARVISQTCSVFGWTVDRADSGEAAIELITRAEDEGRAFEVVLMDWLLPGADGLDTARRLRQRQSADAAPVVIMITAHGREILAEEQQGGAPPFADFLVKPVTPAQLAEAVRKALDGPASGLPFASPVAGRRRLGGLRILVVEDNALNREVAAELLSAEGARVELATGGRESIEILSARPDAFDAVLMDMQMPDIDGLEATRRIRSDERFAALPVLAMTANATQADRETCLAAGMNDHIGKPVDVEDLVCKLRQAVRITGSHTLDPSAAPSARALPPAAADEAYDKILQRFGGNRALFARMLAQFPNDAQRLITDARECLQTADCAGVASALHGLKGSAGTMGASALSRRAAELEQEFRHAPATPDEMVGSDVLAAELTTLLQRDVDRLKLFAGEPADTRDGVSRSASMEQSVLADRLRQIAALLEAGSLDVLELLDSLPDCPDGIDPGSFHDLRDRVKALDFPAALKPLRQILETLG